MPKELVFMNAAQILNIAGLICEFLVEQRDSFRNNLASLASCPVVCSLGFSNISGSNELNTPSACALWRC
jgi:hypothetical protein